MPYEVAYLLDLRGILDIKEPYGVFVITPTFYSAQVIFAHEHRFLREYL